MLFRSQSQRLKLFVSGPNPSPVTAPSIRAKSAVFHIHIWSKTTGSAVSRPSNSKPSHDAATTPMTKPISACFIMPPCEFCTRLSASVVLKKGRSATTVRDPSGRGRKSLSARAVSRSYPRHDTLGLPCIRNQFRVVGKRFGRKKSEIILLTREGRRLSSRSAFYDPLDLEIAHLILIQMIQ